MSLTSIERYGANSRAMSHLLFNFNRNETNLSADCLTMIFSISRALNDFIFDVYVLSARDEQTI